MELELVSWTLVSVDDKDVLSLLFFSTVAVRSSVVGCAKMNM